MNELERLCRDFLNKVGSLTPIYTTNKKKNPNEFKHLIYEVEINEDEYDWEALDFGLDMFSDFKEFSRWCKDKGMYMSYNNQRFILEDLWMKRMEGRYEGCVYTYRFKFVEI